MSNFYANLRQIRARRDFFMFYDVVCHFKLTEQHLVCNNLLACVTYDIMVFPHNSVSEGFSI